MNAPPSQRRRKVVIIHAEPFESDLVPALEAQGCDVVLITHRGRDSDESYKKLCPLSLNSPEASFGMVPEGWTGPIHPAHERDIEAMAPYESRVFELLERINFEGRPTQELRSRYLHLLGLWGTFLDELQPDAVVFRGGLPNKGYDFVAHGLAHVRNIQVVIFAHTMIDGRLMLMRDMYTPRGPSPADIAEAVEQGVTFTEKERDETIVKLHAAANDLSKLRAKSTWPNMLRTLVGRRQLDRLWPVPYFLDDPTPRYLTWRWRTFQGKVTGRKLLAHYDSISVPARLDRPFVYLPLGTQPETQTCVNGRHFADHWLIAHIVSEALPPGWRILIKEHPNQFNRGFMMSKGRNLEFYRRLKALPNVDLVHLETNPNLLVQKCQAVAVTAGSTGWDAMLQGKPALTFGIPWYEKAPGAIATRTVENAKATLAGIADGIVTVDARALSAYRALMRDHYTFPGLLLNAFVGRTEVSVETHVENCVREIVNVLDEASAAPTIAQPTAHA